jgi:hypothetical protein
VTRGSQIHTDLGRHFTDCAQCRATDVENRRKKHDEPGHVSERDVPPDALAAMCPDGRAIYRAYLYWLAEPDW